VAVATFLMAWTAASKVARVRPVIMTVLAPASAKACAVAYMVTRLEDREEISDDNEVEAKPSPQAKTPKDIDEES
jgi:hypothetical protein